MKMHFKSELLGRIFEYAVPGWVDADLRPTPGLQAHLANILCAYERYLTGVLEGFNIPCGTLVSIPPGKIFGALRFLHFANPPESPFSVFVGSMLEAVVVGNMIAQFDLEMGERVSSNAQGLEAWDGEDWSEYEDHAGDTYDDCYNKIIAGFMLNKAESQ